MKRRIDQLREVPTVTTNGTNYGIRNSAEELQNQPYRAPSTPAQEPQGEKTELAEYLQVVADNANLEANAIKVAIEERDKALNALRDAIPYITPHAMKIKAQSALSKPAGLQEEKK